MPYFFILPAFVLYVAAMALAIVIVTVYRPMAWLRPYFVSALLWSSVGFVLSIALVVAALFVMLEAVVPLTSGQSTVGGIALGIAMLVGPFAATALGVGSGAIFGVLRTFRRIGPQLRIPTDAFPPEP